MTSWVILQLAAPYSQAQQPVDILDTSDTLVPDISGDYVTPGSMPFGTGAQIFPPDQMFNMQFNTGIGNTTLDGFSIMGTAYSRITDANEVMVRRAGNSASSTERFRYFAEAALSGNDINIRPSRPDSIRDIMMGNILNRGVLDFFRNKNNGVERANNVERLDVIFSQGIRAPATALNEAGFIQIEKSGNNPFKIAAITALSAAGTNPAAYGPLILVQATDYGATNLTTTNTWFHNDVFDNPPGSGIHGDPAPFGGQRENLGAVFISLADLGISANQTFFGYSTFGDDVDDTVHNLLQPRTFPQDTAGPLRGGNGADFFGGTAGYFSTAALQAPVLGVAKQVTLTIDDSVTLSIHIENYGIVPLTNLSIVDDLDTTFGAGTYTVSSAPVITTPPATSTVQLNPGYTGASGATTAELLDTATSSLEPGEFAIIEFTVTVNTLIDQGSGRGIYFNTAVGSGDPPTGPGDRAVDSSTDGADPDADGNNADGTTDGDSLPDEDVPTMITIINQPPVAVADTVVTQLNTPVTVPVTSNDTDPDGTLGPATVDLDPATPGRQTSVTVPGQGTFSADNSGNVTFTPVAGFTGTSTIPYTVSDNDGDASNPSNLSVRVNAPPVAMNDSAVTSLNTPVTFSAIANDTDRDGAVNPATVDLDPATPGRQPTFSVPGEGTYSTDNTGTVTFTPVPGFLGTSMISYTVNDNLGAPANPATILITVRPPPPINMPPVAADDSDTTLPNTPVTVAVLNNDSDPDGDALSVVQVAQPPSGAATLNPNGTITYTPAPNTIGPVVFPYTISDGRGGTATARITITLTDTLNPPLGLKTGEANPLPQLTWTLVWINAENSVGNAARVTDSIPTGTTYVPNSLTCTPQGASTVDRCVFEAAANRIVYEGTIAPDPGLRTEAEAVNEVVITYRTAVPLGFFGDIANQAEANWDANGNGSVEDEVAAGQSPVLTDDPTSPGTSNPTVVTISPSDGSEGGDDTDGGDDPAEGGVDSE